MDSKGEQPVHVGLWNHWRCR